MTERQTGIELGRVAAVVAVICIHAHLADATAASDWYATINQLGRFAVPFFFVAIGYFGRLGTDLARAGRTVLILLALYFAWYAAYATLFHAGDFRIEGAGIEGSHLWFLRSAAYGIAFVALLRRFAGPTAMLVVALALFVMGVLLGAYSPLTVGADLTATWSARNSLCFSAPFIAIGALLAERGVVVRPWQAAIVAATGGLLQFVEGWLLRQPGVSADVETYDFVVATLPYGVGAFLFFQSLNGSRVAGLMAPLGPLTLGIYLVHRAVLAALGQVDAAQPALLFWPYVAAVFLMSLLIVAAVNAIPVVRGMVTTGPPWPALRRRRGAASQWPAPREAGNRRTAY